MTDAEAEPNPSVAKLLNLTANKVSLESQINLSSNEDVLIDSSVNQIVQKVITEPLPLASAQELMSFEFDVSERQELSESTKTPVEFESNNSSEILPMSSDSLKISSENAKVPENQFIALSNEKLPVLNLNTNNCQAINNDSSNLQIQKHKKNSAMPSTSKSTLKNEKNLKRRPKLSLDEKIALAEKHKDACLKQLKILEKSELPEGKEIFYIERIDKLRAKLVEIEEALTPYVTYEDAEYGDCLKDHHHHKKIVLINTDLDPLNAMLTEHVNILITKMDKCAGFRCVTIEDVEQMLNQIKEKGDCPIFYTVVPKDKELYENFILNVVEKTNVCCRKILLKQLLDEDYNTPVLISDSTKGSTISEDGMSVTQISELKAKTGASNLAKACPAFEKESGFLSEKLIKMKSEGLLDVSQDNEFDEIIDILSPKPDDDEDEDDFEEEQLFESEECQVNVFRNVNKKRSASVLEEKNVFNELSKRMKLEDDCSIENNSNDLEIIDLNFEKSEYSLPGISGVTGCEDDDDDIEEIELDDSRPQSPFANLRLLISPEIIDIGSDSETETVVSLTNNNNVICQTNDENVVNEEDDDDDEEDDDEEDDDDDDDDDDEIEVIYQRTK